MKSLDGIYVVGLINLLNKQSSGQWMIFLNDHGQSL